MSVEITAIQRGCVYDGEGIRTTVFLRGCALRCPWCCNPESWSDEKFFFDKSKCLHFSGQKSLLCTNCEITGGEKNKRECPFGAVVPSHRQIPIDELLEICLKDKELYKTSHGGVTFSGGEPILQANNLLPLLEGLKENEVNICFETTLIAPPELIDSILPFTDSLIIDLKLQPVSVGQGPLYDDDIKVALNSIPGRIGIRFRLVFIDDMLRDVAEIATRLKTMKIDNIELLSAHNLGEGKYRKLGLNSKDFSARPELLAFFASELSHAGISASVLSL